jgi:hypothetical protein
MVKAWPDLLFANISPVVERSRDIRYRDMIPFPKMIPNSHTKCSFLDCAPEEWWSRLRSTTVRNLGTSQPAGWLDISSDSYRCRNSFIIL